MQHVQAQQPLAGKLCLNLTHHHHPEHFMSIYLYLAYIAHACNYVDTQQLHAESMQKVKETNTLLL